MQWISALAISLLIKREWRLRRVASSLTTGKKKLSRFWLIYWTKNGQFIFDVPGDTLRAPALS